jgi:hypothetical protein
MRTALRLAMVAVALGLAIHVGEARAPITNDPAAVRVPRVSAAPAKQLAGRLACAFRAAATPGGQTGCAGCESRCETQIRACKNGSIRSCYLAAACLCQCNLDAGGCGSSTTALRQCVEQNERLAQELRE